MTCGYCDELIEGADYIYKWFPDLQQMLTVHAYHLNATRNMEKGSSYERPSS